MTIRTRFQSFVLAAAFFSAYLDVSDLGTISAAGRWPKRSLTGISGGSTYSQPQRWFPAKSRPSVVPSTTATARSTPVLVPTTARRRLPPASTDAARITDCYGYGERRG